MLAKLGAFIDASVGRRLGLGMCTMLLAGLAISTIFFVRDERREMEQILWEKGKTALHITEPRVGRAIEAQDPHAIEVELNPLLEDQDFDYAYVFDNTHMLANAADEGSEPGPHSTLPKIETLHPGHFIPRVSRDYLEIVTPVMVNGSVVAGLGLGVSLDLSASQGRRIGRRLLLVTLTLLSTALAFIYWWTRKTVAPLETLIQGAERFTRGDLSVRVPVVGIDELGRLSSTFNHLAESLQKTLEEKDRMLAETKRLYRNLKVANARLGQAERLSAIGMLAAGVSHELNNPLGIILSTAGNLREAVDEGSPWVEDVAIIEAEAERCRRIIQGLLNFAASGDSHPVEVDLNSVIRETFGLAVHDHRAQHLVPDWALDPHLPELWVDPRQMQQVFLNLLLNAADAMEGHGVVRLRTAESIEGGQRKVLIEFTDQGCGISPDDLEHIFDPFYTTKKGGAGFGLGLAVSYGIIAAHGGEITVASKVGRGSTFTIILPVRSEATQVDTANQMR